MKKVFLLLVIILAGRVVRAQQFYAQTPQAMHWVDSVYKSLTKAQRVAQLIVMRESERTPNGPKYYDSAVVANIIKYNIGALCQFQGNPVQQALFTNRFQQLAKTPIMMCIDGETGIGMRMIDSVMKFPDQLTLGAVQDTALIYRIGRAMGAQCKREGIQVDYAPVVDINNNPNNPVIGFRSFGEDKYKVALFATMIMRGLQDEGVLACAKHFPGHGDVSVDSHVDLPVINKTMAQLDSMELYPFKQLFAAGVGSVMVAHLSIPAIDTTTHLPTSLSKNNVNDLLRHQLGYTGISFTDALEMKGVAKYYPDSEGALQSLMAGNDMLCLPGDIDGSIAKILLAIKKHQLDKNDIAARIKKVLLVKYHLGLHTVQPISTDNIAADLNAAVPALRAEVAQNALTLLQMKQPGLVPVQTNKRLAYVGIGLTEGNTISNALRNQLNADVYYFDYKADSAKALLLLQSLQGKYGTVIIGLHKLSKYPANNFGLSKTAIQLVKDLQQVAPAITMVFGNPYAVKNVCAMPNLIACYEDDAIFQHAAFDWLMGRFNANGKLPVSVCEAFPFGYSVTQQSVALPFASPESVGMSTAALAGIDSVANDAIAKHATPGCVVLVARKGKVVFNKAYGFMSYDSTQAVTTGTLYDLASVTKISATTVSVMKLYEQGKLDITKTLGDYLPWVRGTDKAGLTLENVLLHQAGLNPFIPFYTETIDTATGKPKKGIYASVADSVYSIPVAKDMYLRKDWTDTMYQRILKSKLGTSDKYVYSDNDFIFLGKIVEQITGKTLDAYTHETFYAPLQMATTMFNPSKTIALKNIAPTETEKIFRNQSLRGYVHDPGAAMFGGVAGHAGLFSSAYDLAKLYQLLLNGGELNGLQLLDKNTISFFTAYHSNISRRGLGFDKPEKDNAMRKEAYPSISTSPATFGHTGFTGTCVWADPAKDLIYIFLSNRVNPQGGANGKLGELNVRPKIQEIIYHAILPE